MLKERKGVVFDAPDRWLFNEGELASLLKGRNSIVYPEYVAALKNWVAERFPSSGGLFNSVLAGLDRDLGCYSSPFFHFTSSDEICGLDGRKIRQSRLRFWVPSRSCHYMNQVGVEFVRALRPDLDAVVAASDTHSLVVTAEGYVDLNMQALGETPRSAREEFFKSKK